MTGSVFVITGVMASGKSTVAQRLAERLPRSAHIRGDVFRRMIINGRAEPAPEPDAAAVGSDEAKSQLRLRYRLSPIGRDRGRVRRGRLHRDRPGCDPWT